MFEQTFKNNDDIFHDDACCGSELDMESAEILNLISKLI